MQQSMPTPLSLVIAVAKEDKRFAEELKNHLQPLSKAGQLTCWFPDQIPPGLDRTETIKQQCQQANLFLMLLSADFLSSPDYETFTEQALKRESEGLARIFPIMLRDVGLGSTFQDRELLPRNQKPINRWLHTDDAWLEIIEQINTLIASQSECPSAPRNPYKGLRSFQLEDTNDFFGRTHLIEGLHTELKNVLTSDQPRLLAVIGPSGVGKSSVVLAGLLPYIQKK